MENVTQIIQGLYVVSQLHLDPKTKSVSENQLKDLGTDFVLAYAYPNGLIVDCIKEETTWVWREALDQDEIGLLDENFIYPNGIVYNDFDYSLKSFNFFQKKTRSDYVIDESDFAEKNLTDVLNTIKRNLSLIGNVESNKVLKTGEVSINGLNLFIEEDVFNWRIDFIDFLNTPSYSVTFSGASEGNYRSVVLVGNNQGNYEIIEGDESSSITKEPDIPLGFIRLVGFSLFGNVVGNPVPTPTSNFVLKTEEYPILVNGGGGGQFTLDNENGYFEIQSYGSPIESIYDQQGYIYPGREITFKNNSSENIVFYHNPSLSEMNKKFFTFPNNQDFVLQPNEICKFKMSNDGRLCYIGLISSILGEIKQDKNYKHIQGIPANIWNINHNFDKYPSVSILDNSGNEIEAEVLHINKNSLVIHFSVELSGVAIMN